jgi:hypothetical protein
MAIKKWNVCNPMVTAALLASFIGFATVGCSNTVGSSDASSAQGNIDSGTNPTMESETESETVVAAATAPELSPDPKRPTAEEDIAEAPEVVGLSKDMPYEDARALLIQQGWQPSSPDAPESLANLNNTGVQELVDKGYEEAKECSGTGLGLCLFEFSYEDGTLLSVSVAAATGNIAVWDWFIKGDIAGKANMGAGSDLDSQPASPGNDQ